MLVFVIEVAVFESHDFEALVIFLGSASWRRLRYAPETRRAELALGTRRRLSAARQQPHFRLTAAPMDDAWRNKEGCSARPTVGRQR